MINPLSGGTSASGWMAAILVGMVGLIAVAGCGGGGDSTTALTKAEFTKEANRICKKTGWKIRGGWAWTNRRYYQIEGVKTESEPANIPLEAKLLRWAVDRFALPAMNERLEDLEGLNPPAGDEAKVSKMLDTYAILIDELEDEGAAAPDQFETLSDFLQEASALGLDCSATYRPSPPGM
ncbi:MAG TPA: hypothetical protein VFZ19_05750 [Solirubrobacterales bacterium]